MCMLNSITKPNIESHETFEWFEFRTKLKDIQMMIWAEWFESWSPVYRLEQFFWDFLVKSFNLNQKESFRK